MLALNSRPVLFYGVLLSMIWAAACSDDGPTAPSALDLGGTARFTYIGDDRDGAFEAAGLFERDDFGYMKLQPFATAIDVTVPRFDLAYFGIVAAVFQPPLFDDMSILLSSQTTDTFDIILPDDCVVRITYGGGSCAAISFDIGLSIDGLAGGVTFEFISGSVVVSSVTRDRVVGTFSGVARPLAAQQSISYNLAEAEVTIQDGSFDVPIITLDDWNGTNLLAAQLTRRPAARIGSEFGLR